MFDPLSRKYVGDDSRLDGASVREEKVQLQLPRETAIAAKGALLHVGCIASDDLLLLCRIRGSASIYSIPAAIIRRSAIELMVSPRKIERTESHFL